MSSGETSAGKGQGDETGRLLAGRYRVVSQLGRGGMGVVWRAVDEVLGREVAVKELRTYTDADGPELADLRLRMQREARAAARVRHPGVVAVHDVAEVDGRPLIVMELVDGPSLDDVLRERGTLDAREAADIGAKVMDALAAAHRAGVLHRDVKPGNILLDRSGRVVLTDFGIATMEDPGDGSATHLTRSGELVGSLDYLAPERAQGADPGPASDIWALGATLYAAVEGSSPFRRTSTYSTLAAIVTEPLPESRHAGSLAPVLRRLMDKRPDARPEAEQARELLQAVVDRAGTDTPTTTLRGAAAPVREETERSVPSVPPGFGSVERVGTAGPAGPGFGLPGTEVTGAQGDQGAGSAEWDGGGAHGFGAAGRARQQASGSAGQPGRGAQGFGPAQQGVQGFGAARQPGQAGPGFGSAEPAAHAAGGFGPPAPAGPTPASAPTGLLPTQRSPRHKGRALLAAAAVTVVLAAAGVTVALMNNSGDAEARTQPTSSSTRAETSSSASGRTDADRSDDAKPTQQGHEKTPTATETPSHQRETTPSGKATPSASSDSAGGGSGNGGTPTGGATTEAPACQSIGGGKYNCTVWRTAKSYTASGTEVGVLGAGTNYFYCQQNLGRRETYGQWTNVWWAKTDDDSGNTNVYVSDVYIKGGDNDEPVPGLPVC
ncbi:serine/threonine-protein kinase [Streptomyces sp. NPDC047043]|uniref:serine/threonine-protein kinase n=1 Tax=Streptomyces sp. NPDC047043 TaxID=3154497 RepID=UPI0033FB4F40